MEIARWVWEEPHLLECNGDCRIISRPADGVPYYSDGRHLQTLIFGREEQFHTRSQSHKVLRTLEERLGLDPEKWRWQAPFYEQLLRSFFRPKSSPGWIKIANSRVSFRGRLAGIRGKAEHFGYNSQKLFKAKFLGSETFSFQDSVLRTTFLRMKYLAEVPKQDLNVYNVTIFRTLKDDGFGGSLTCHENWLHLGTAAREDRQARREGVNLAIKEFPAADPLGRMSPLISFCRMTDDRQWVLSRCFSLCPGSGEAIDFRTVTHRIAFYCRSDLSNAALLAQAITPGQYERFANG